MAQQCFCRPVARAGRLLLVLLVDIERRRRIAAIQTLQKLPSSDTAEPGGERSALGIKSVKLGKEGQENFLRNLFRDGLIAAHLQCESIDQPAMLLYSTAIASLEPPSAARCNCSSVNSPLSRLRRGNQT